VVPIRALLDTVTLPLSEDILWAKADHVPTQRKEPSGKHLEVLSLQIVNLFLISNFQILAQAKL
jgi:hypothetical protein